MRQFNSTLGKDREKSCCKRNSDAMEKQSISGIIDTFIDVENDIVGL